MRVYKDTTFELSFMPWELEPPRTTLMVVVKGTFDLRDNVPCTIAEEQVSVLGEVPWDDGEPPSIRTETDYAVLKTRGEWYLTGRAYSAGAPATVLPVRVKIGPLQKQIAVWGDRVWKRGVLGGAPSEPTPFMEMPLRWERSFGGPGYVANPVGRGLGTVETPDGTIDALPNIEEPSRPLLSRDDRPKPAGMFAIPSTWQERIEKTGTYDALWKASRWPFFPRDFDFEFFGCAPPDQRLKEGFWRGDEPIELAGLHPEHPRLTTRLPGLRPRFFVEWAQPRPPDATPLELLSSEELRALGAPSLQEVRLQLDTIVIDSDARHVLCQWRGLVEVADKQMTNVARVFAIHEPLDADCSPEHYEAWFLRHLVDEAAEFESDGSEEPDVDELALSDGARMAVQEDELAVAMAKFDREYMQLLEVMDENLPDAPLPEPQAVRDKYTELGLPADEILPEPEPPELPELAEPASLLRLIALVRRRLDKPFTDMDLSGSPFQGLDFSGADFSGSLLTDASFVGANLEGAKFDGATLARADLTRARASGTSFREADLTKLRATDAVFEEANFDGASGSHAVMIRANFRRASMLGTELEACDLTHCDLRDANLDGADFVESTLVEAGFIGSSLADTSLEGVKARGAVFERCRMPDLRASDGADFTGANFVLVDAPGAQFQGATLTDANFSGSNLEGADLSESKAERVNLMRCVLKSTKLDRADLQEAILIQANLFEASLEEANLERADARGAHLYSAHLWRARTEGTLFDGAVLDLTVLGGDGG